MSLKQITEEKKKNKREFSLEKIATAIHCGNIISSIRNKYIDPLILRKRHLMYKAKSRHFNENLRSDPFSLKKILYHEFIKQQLKKEDEEGKESPNKNNLSEQILPIIPNKNIRQMNADENNSQKFSDNLLITSGMFKQKEYCKDPNQKVKLYNIITLNNNVNDENIIKKCYPKIENIEKINEKYKLQLDLKHLFDDNKEMKKSKKMTKKALMNYLFKKYVSSANDISEDNKNNEKEKKIKKKPKKYSIISIKSRNSQKDEVNSYNNSADSDNMNIDILKKEFLSEDNTNTFITKVDLPKENDIIKTKCDTTKKNSKIKNLKLYEKNKNIISHDSKVTIDCLYPSIRTEIDHNKLVYDSIEKTTFQLQKEHSYKKVKEFESKIDKILKKSCKKYK
jgi:hypothetical protein